MRSVLVVVDMLERRARALDYLYTYDCAQLVAAEDVA